MSNVDSVDYAPALCRRCGVNACRIGRAICLACTELGIQQRQEEIVRREREDAARYALALAQARLHATPPAPGQPHGACTYCGTHGWVHRGGGLWGCRSCGRSPRA